MSSPSCTAQVHYYSARCTIIDGGRGVVGEIERYFDNTIVENRYIMRYVIIIIIPILTIITTFIVVRVRYVRVIFLSRRRFESVSIEYGIIKRRRCCCCCCYCVIRSVVGTHSAVTAQVYYRTTRVRQRARRWLFFASKKKKKKKDAFVTRLRTVGDVIKFWR